MKILQDIALVLVVLVVIGAAQAQTDNSQPPADTTQQPAEAGQQGSNPPVGAFGQEPPAQTVTQFPPLSGLDEASLEPNYAARSFLIPGLQVTELADTNAGNQFRTGANSFTGDTHLLGSLALQRIWRRYEASLDYRGGGTLYTGRSALPNSQVHSMDLTNRILWRTGALNIRDSFSYLPEGIFGGGFGGASTLGGGGQLGGGGVTGGGGGGGPFGVGQIGTLGSAPRMSNISIVDMQNSLSPRSAVTLAGGYAFSHFTGSGTGLLDSREVIGQAGYNYALSRRNTVAVMYSFQQFTFPSGGGGRFNANAVQFLFGHQISGRMDLILGGGPQFIHLASNSPTIGKQNRISGVARATLRYRLRKSTLSFGYDRYETPGSGLFAGATSDIARLSVMHPLTRRWQLTGDLGYSHNSRVQTSTLGVNAGSYDYAYVGGRLSRTLSRTLQGFVMYQFNDLRLSNSVCATQAACGSVSNRHLIGIGLTWHPQAIRLD